MIIEHVLALHSLRNTINRVNVTVILRMPFVYLLIYRAIRDAYSLEKNYIARKMYIHYFLYFSRNCLIIRVKIEDLEDDICRSRR